MTGGTGAEVDVRRKAVGIQQEAGWQSASDDCRICWIITSNLQAKSTGTQEKWSLGQRRRGEGRAAELSLRKPFLVEPLLIQLFVSIQFSPDYANYMWTQSFGAFARSFLSLEWIIKVTLTWAKIMLKDFETLHVGIDVKAAPDWLLAGWLVLPLTWIYGVLREAEKKTVNESPRVMKSTFCLFYVRNFTLTEIFP